jgi:hypothetical protein
MRALAALNHWSSRSVQHHDETHLFISLPLVLSFIASIARTRPELNRGKTWRQFPDMVTAHEEWIDKCLQDFEITEVVELSERLRWATNLLHSDQS